MRSSSLASGPPELLWFNNVGLKRGPFSEEGVAHSNGDGSANLNATGGTIGLKMETLS